MIPGLPPPSPPGYYYLKLAFFLSIAPKLKEILDTIAAAAVSPPPPLPLLRPRPRPPAG